LVEVEDIADNLRLILNWLGSEMKLSVYDPSGQLYAEYQTSQPPIEVDISDPSPGSWRVEVTAIDIPEDNYPFAMVAATANEPSVDVYLTDFDIAYVPEEPYQGEIVDITIAVHCSSISQPVDHVLVRCYLGDPDSGGVQIDEDEYAVDLIPGGSGSAYFHWNTEGHIGENEIYVVVDPNDAIREIEEGNNRASRVITITLGPCQDLSHELSPAGWHMISLPGELCSPCLWAEDAEICGDLVCALCDDLDPCFIFYWNAAQHGYTQAPPSEGICYHAGIGFWVRTYEDEVMVDAEVQVSDQAVEVPLRNGWNQIGNPFPVAISIAGLRVRCNSTELSLLEAQAQGWVSAHLFGYDTATGGYQEVALPNGSLGPWCGYWLRAYRDDCMLVIQLVQSSDASPAAHSLSLEELRARGVELPPPPPTFTPMSEAMLDELVVRNVPNPIRCEHTTTFKVEGKGAELVQAIRVEIYNQCGQKVFTQAISAKELEWHTDNDAGELLANGVYLYQVWVKIGDTWYPTGIKKLAVVR
jgi:hypothetical protein